MSVIQPGDATRIATPDSLIRLRRAIHQTPELRFAMGRTATLVEERLRAAGWELRTGIATSGILATTRAAASGPHLLLRADMDAVAVDDLKDVPYASTVPGATHACGHDVHTAIMVGVAERLAEVPLPAGRVSIVFQPAEEMPYGEPSGAMTMLEEGIFDGDGPDAAIALHCWPDLPAGTIGVDERIAMAGKDAFRIELEGRAAHAATPSRGRDAILGMAQVVAALHQGYARSLDPGDLAAFNIGTMAGGTSQSIVAARAEATGTIRSVDPSVRDRLRAATERIVSGAAQLSGLEQRLTWSEIVPPIVNDPRLVRCALEVGRDVLGGAQTRELRVPPMTADDFAFFAELAPALYLKLGVCGSESCAPLHSGAFDADERAIGVGIAVMHEMTLRLLTRTIDAWAEA